MSDLVSRKEVVEIIENLCTDGNMYGNENLTLIDAYAAIDKITELNVAYDVDNVVEKLEELKHPYTSFSEGYGALNEYDYYIEKAKEIAKGAVKDE